MPRWTVLASLACSAIHASTFVFGRFEGRWAVKALSVALLAAFARRYPMLALALLLGSIGDALLDIGPSLFVAGLVAFLLGHVVYTACFVRSGARKAPAAWAGLALFAVVYIAWLWPALGAMRVPVALYVTAITAMTMSSFRVGGWVAAGAVLFLLSDSLLAADRFHAPVPLHDWLIWFTYYFGQMAIALGYVARRSRNS